MTIPNLLDLPLHYDEPWKDTSRWTRTRTHVQHQRAARGHLAVAETDTSGHRWFVNCLVTGKSVGRGTAQSLTEARRFADEALDIAAGTLPFC